MAPRSERFEMRIDDEMIERLDEWRQTQGDTPSRAEAVRRLIDRGLSDEREVTLRPTQTERLMIWMLAELLESQKNFEDKKTIKLIKEAIFGGHFWSLDWQLTGVLHNHIDDPATLKHVVDAMDMWNFIEWAWAAFTDEQKAEVEKGAGVLGKNPRFAGFDGNQEAEHLGIARHLVEELGRFEQFKGRGMNSHFPTVGRDTRMLQRFKAMRLNLMGGNLSVKQVIEVLKAGEYPRE